tara:strand:- start:6966 stop:8105 length:1140 start_codon:yes stop_codon:yes gene_type:complete
MKKLLFQKFLKDTTKFFIIIAFSIGLIVWVIQAVGFLDFVTEDGHGFYVYFKYTTLNFPKIIHRILPFVFFISIFYQITQYERKNELLIFWTNGVSKLNFINVIIVYAVLVALFQIILGGFISPKSQYEAKNFIKNSNIDFFPSLIKEGKFIDTVKNLTIFIEKKDEFGNYQNIFLNDNLDTTVGGGFKNQVVYAKKGILYSDSKNRFFRLFDGHMINTNNNKTTTISFKKIDFNLSKYESKTTTTPKIQTLESKALIGCIYHDLKNMKDKFQHKYLLCNDKFIKDVKQELFKRFYKPIYLPLLALISSLLILMSKENQYYGHLKLTLFTFIFFIIIFSEMSLRYISYDQMGLVLFVSFPLLIFFLLYFVLTVKLKSNI